MKRFTLLLIMSAMSFGVQAEDFLYILSARAKLLSAPSFESTLVQNVTKGEKLISLEKNNRWFKVKYRDKEGWVSRLSVSPHPPGKRRNRLAATDSKALEKHARRRASAVSTTAAVRGVRNINKAGLESNELDTVSLAKIERLSVSISEIDAFIANRPQ